jgi:hypothetical protein
MRFRIITGEKSKSLAIMAIGASFYLIESAFEESGASVIRGLGIFLAIHALVLVAKCILVIRKAASDGGMAKLLKFVVVATLLTGLFSVCCIYASGRAFDTDWRAYVNALVIGGLSAIFHLVPLEKFKRKSADLGVFHRKGSDR